MPLSCLWMYQLLVKCNWPGLIQFLRLKYEHQMSPAHVNYLNSISNKQQFPAVRCAMAELVCMYGKTASSGVEGMNGANDSIRRQIAIDILNAALVLINKESEQCERSKSDAWKREVWSKEKPRTPWGTTVMKDIFEKCNTLLFRIHVSKNTTAHTATICKKSSPQREYSVVIPNGEQIHGSRFNTCSCGYPKKRVCRVTTWWQL
jgi:hypothetical protein